MKLLRLTIPATTANFGAGFDVFGAALKLYNEIEVFLLPGVGEDKKLQIAIEGEGKNQLPRDEQNVVWQAMRLVFNRRKKRNVRFKIKLTNRIPLARGLGSSAAARIGGLVAANKICGNKLSNDEIIKIATQLEGHPDNVIPAYFGGLGVCNYDSRNVKYTKIKMPPDLKAVLCIPDFEVSTDKARMILPKTVPHKDAVFNLNRVALFLLAIIRRKYEFLSLAMEDKLHQPYRKKIIPGMNAVFDSAKKSGAYGVCISGSGPTILAVSSQRLAERIGKMMQKTFLKHNVKSKYIICDFDNSGTKVLNV